jgi:hypothetical protein
LDIPAVRVEVVLPDWEIASSGMFWEFFIEPNEGHFGQNATKTLVY